MHITLMMVISLDGRSTRGDQPGTSSWASPEDQAAFMEQKNSHDCIVMGRSSYEAARAIIQPSPAKPRFVLTSKPHHFVRERRPGLEFVSSTPQEIVKQIESRGHQTLLLVGGATTNARFIDAGLVDELCVVIEPLLFGAGLPLVRPLYPSGRLQLISCRQLNYKGTLLARYLILKTGRSVKNEDSEI